LVGALIPNASVPSKTRGLSHWYVLDDIDNLPVAMTTRRKPTR
jgi:hypothetical protein